MRFIHHLLPIVSAARCAFPWMRGRAATPGRGTGRDKKLLFGIEIIVTGAASAVSLPDGRLVGVAAVDGGPEYVSQMRDWYETCTSRNNSLEEKKALVLSRYPHESPEERDALHLSWRDFEEASGNSWVDRWRDRLGLHPKNIDKLYAQTSFQGDSAMQILQVVLTELFEATKTAIGDITEFPMPEKP